MKTTRAGSLALLAAAAFLLTAVPAEAADSIWSAGVGKILPSDDTVWCAYDITAPGGIYTVRAKLQRRNTAGGLVTDNYTDGGVTTLSLRMQCRNVTTNVITAPSSSGFGNNATLTCPANNVAIFPRCMLRSTDANPFTYNGGNMGGHPCGAGVSLIKPPAGSDKGFKGQVTGFTSELNFRALVGNKMFNAAVMKDARVHGTDMGFFFYASGQLWAGYGDTWEDPGFWSIWPTYRRGSVLFSTNDLDASDSNGLSFSSYHGKPSFAPGVIPCCYSSPPFTPLCDEFSAIPTAGFGLSEPGHSYRFLWFNAIQSWTPFTSKLATLAWSENGGPFKRADQEPGIQPPLWSNTSSFGAGAIYQDRLGGYLYFFGSRPYASTPSPIRLARVPATYASVLDRTKYEYWDGSLWRKSVDPMAFSELGAWGGAADIIPAGVTPGPEFSVAFDAFANRYIMLFETDRWGFDPEVELWQSSSLTGPWSRVVNGKEHLPRAGTTGGQWSPYNFFYGPYMSEQLMKQGGENIYFQMSEWNGIGGFRPYNTGLWTFGIGRALTPGCQL